jgi:hypothetical protein
MHALRRAALVYLAVVITTASLVFVGSLWVAIGVTTDRMSGSVGSMAWISEEFWRAVLVLALIYVMAASLPTPIGVPTAAMGANVPVLIAAYIIAGPVAAALVAATGMLSYSHWSLVKRVFNHAQFVLVAFGAGVVYVGLGGQSAADFRSVNFGVNVVLPALVSSIVAMALNALLLFGVLKTVEGLSFRSLWRTVIAGSAVPYLGYGLFGLLMAVLWSVGGGFGASLVLLPLLIARWAYQQYAEQQKAYEATIRALVQAVETKDHYTRGHSERVAHGCVRIAQIRAMTADRVTALRYAGILHDVGKLSVTTRLLQKTEPLSDLEYEEIKMHPVTGREMLRGIAFLEEAYEGILHHHERLDGLGYPLGLQGGDIPEFARVIAVADAFDSMTSTRSYRGARSIDDAVAELEACKNTQFDPEMVDAMIESLRREPWRAGVVVPLVDSDLPGAAAAFDHDDPTAPLPLGTDDVLRAAAEAAEASDRADSSPLSTLRRQDDA